MISDDHALHFADAIVSLLHAGLSVQRALYEAPRWLDEPASSVLHGHTAALAVGAPIRDVIASLGRLNTLLPSILPVLTQASRDGVPAAEQLAMVVAEVRDQRRRVHEQRLARLPVKLTLPVVLCILPAFIALGVVPLVIAVMPALGSGATP
jgi:Flp pilus assembly protein TadB